MQSTSQKSSKLANVLHLPLFLGSLSFIFLLFGLPIFGKSIGASALEIGGLYSIFTVTTMVLRPFVGWALDRYSRKRFFVASLLSYAVTMLVFAFSEGISGLYIARFCEGIAAACLWISIRTITADLSAPEERGHAMGKLQEIYTRAGLIGVFAGFGLVRFLPHGAAWKIAFLGYAIAAAIGAWQAWLVVPETRSLPSEPDELPKSRSISRQLMFLMAIVFTTGLAEALISPIYLIFLQDRFEAGVVALAWAFFPAGLVMSVLPSYLGRLSDRLGRASMIATGLASTGLLFGCLPLLPHIEWLIVLYTLSSIGLAMATPAKTALVADLSQSQNRGSIYGLYELALRLGATVGPLLGGWLYDSISHALPFYVTGGIMLSSAVLACFLLKPNLHQSAI